MSRLCSLTGRRPSTGKVRQYRGIAKAKGGIGIKITGQASRKFYPNLKKKRVWLPEEKRFVTLKISTAAIRLIDKKGIEPLLKKAKQARVQA